MAARKGSAKRKPAKRSPQNRKAEGTKRGSTPGSKRTQFKKGQSGNPGGRSNADKEFQALCRDAVSKAEVVETLLTYAKSKRSKNHRWAIEKLLEYAHAKPRQEVGLNSGEGGGLLILGCDLGKPRALAEKGE